MSHRPFNRMKIQRVSFSEISTEQGEFYGLYKFSQFVDRDRKQNFRDPILFLIFTRGLYGL